MEYQISRDLVTMRHSAKRKSAVEILQATKSLYVKSPKCQDDTILTMKTDAGKKTKKKDPDQFESKLKRLLDDSSKENISDWGCFEDLNFKFYTDCDVQYQSLPDLSISSKESTSCTLHLEESGGSDKMTISSESVDNSRTSSSSSSSSGKSYGKPPSQASFVSLGGSASKVEVKLTSWSQPKHEVVTRSRSWTCIKQESVESENPSKDLNDFFEHLGLTSEEYRALRNEDSAASSPVFFSSRSSQGSCCSRVAHDGQDLPPSDPPSVVQTNARVIKWLCRLGQS